MLLRRHAILFHRSRVDVVRIVWNRAALLSEISPSRALCDHHLHHGNSSLTFPLHGRTLLGVRSPVTTAGVIVGNRFNRSIPCRDRGRRGGWRPYRLFVHSEAAVTQIAAAIARWRPEPLISLLFHGVSQSVHEGDVPVDSLISGETNDCWNFRTRCLRFGRNRFQAFRAGN